MNLILTNHAKKRLIERNVKIEDIKTAIEFPDYTITKDNKKEAYKRIKGKVLNVVYSKEDKYIKVITLIWK